MTYLEVLLFLARQLGQLVLLENEDCARALEYGDNSCCVFFVRAMRAGSCYQTKMDCCTGNTLPGICPFFTFFASAAAFSAMASSASCLAAAAALTASGAITCAALFFTARSPSPASSCFLVSDLLFDVPAETLALKGLLLEQLADGLLGNDGASRALMAAPLAGRREVLPAVDWAEAVPETLLLGGGRFLDSTGWIVGSFAILKLSGWSVASVDGARKGSFFYRSI